MSPSSYQTAPPRNSRAEIIGVLSLLVNMSTRYIGGKPLLRLSIAERRRNLLQKTREVDGFNVADCKKVGTYKKEKVKRLFWTISKKLGFVGLKTQWHFAKRHWPFYTGFWL